jgi:beta-lactamase superfamily II metal-dependent hydrolase
MRLAKIYTAVVKCIQRSKKSKSRIDNEIIIEAFPAEDGDCFIISLSNGMNILVDGGYPSTFTKYLKPRLEELNRLGQVIDLMIITHIDQDHIKGALSFLNENGPSDAPSIIPVKEIWHNSYRHLPKNTARSVRTPTKAEVDAVDRMKVSGGLIADEKEGEREISAKQGSFLAAKILKNGYPWNTLAEGKAISVENVPAINLGHGVNLKILSPNTEKLRKLEKEWRRELEKKLVVGDDVDWDGFDDAFEFLMMQQKGEKLILKEKSISAKGLNLKMIAEAATFVEDNSETNGSSIAFALEYGGKSLLFLGDSHPSVILQNIGGESVYFDLVKVSHHGSLGNTGPHLLKRIDSPKWLFSTNGSKHGHPEKETIAWIVSREGDTRKLYFNYPTQTTSDLAEMDSDGVPKFEMELPSGGKPITIKI